MRVQLSSLLRLSRLLLPILTVCAAPAHAWGDDGHKIVGLIAEHYLTPAAAARVRDLLSGPALPAGLMPADSPAYRLAILGTIADRATWADKFRDSDRRPGDPKSAYSLTHLWHYVDVDTDAPDLDAACFGHPAVPYGPFPGVANNCVVDKIAQFRDVLADPTAPHDQRTVALEFLLHFVGDVHQPLHAAEHAHDKGGNTVKVRYANGARSKTVALHAYWDTVVVARLGSSPESVAALLIAGMPKRPTGSWRETDPAAWARESFAVAKTKAYHLPPAAPGATIALTAAYATAATGAARKQLQRAGYRLAMLLNAAFK